MENIIFKESMKIKNSRTAFQNLVSILKCEAYERWCQQLLTKSKTGPAPPPDESNQFQ